MEKITNIAQKEITAQGYFIEANCCMCNREQIFADYTKKDVLEKLKEEGWKNINSDMYGIMGYYCGCDYKD